MLSFVPTSLEASSTSTSTSPKVQIMQPSSSSLQMVLQMRFIIIRIVAILVLLKQCGISFNSLCMAALQMSIISSYTSWGENQVFFDPDQALPDAVQQAANRRSMLDAFYIVSAICSVNFMVP